jgi:hypothetical protein
MHERTEWPRHLGGVCWRRRWPREDRRPARRARRLVDRAARRRERLARQALASEGRAPLRRALSRAWNPRVPVALLAPLELGRRARPLQGVRGRRRRRHHHRRRDAVGLGAARDGAPLHDRARQGAARCLRRGCALGLSALSPGLPLRGVRIARERADASDG